MTRKEEIEKTAMQVAGVHPDWSNLDCFRMGFREGAKFADKTMLDRACEWLGNELEETYNKNGYPTVESRYFVSVKEFINEFRQAMEGE